MNKLEVGIIKQLDTLDNVLNEQVKNFKAYLENEDDNWIEFDLKNLNINSFEKYKNNGGIYYLQIKFNDKFTSLSSKSQIFDKLVYEWKSDGRNKIPNIIKDRQSKYTKDDLKNRLCFK